MIRQIRQNVFETNSSSTHSICIPREAELSIPKSLHFSFGEFGWEQGTLNTLEDKASYLYTGLIGNDRKDDADKIFDALKSKSIDVTFDEAIYAESPYTKGYFHYENTGYVDHSDQLRDFLDDVCSDEGSLMRYLFSDLAFIITGNDNNPDDVEIDVPYLHKRHYKGN